MSKDYPAFAMFPDLNVIIRLPSGVEYKGKFRQHLSTREEGEHWYEGYLTAQHKDHILADTNLANRFNRDGARPEHFHPDSAVEPPRLKLNRIPRAQRSEKNQDTLLGELWTHEGLWTIIASPSASDRLHLAGAVAPAKEEMAFDRSRIRQFHGRPGGTAPA